MPRGYATVYIIKIISITQKGLYDFYYNLVTLIELL